jgi:hypothetical protein
MLFITAHTVITHYCTRLCAVTSALYTYQQPVFKRVLYEKYGGPADSDYSARNSSIQTDRPGKQQVETHLCFEPIETALILLLLDSITLAVSYY